MPKRKGHQIILQADQTGGTFTVLSDGKPIQDLAGVDVQIRYDKVKRKFTTFSVKQVDGQGKSKDISPKELVADVTNKNPTKRSGKKGA